MFSVQPSAGAPAGRWGACACVRCGPCPELFGLRRHPEVPQKVGGAAAKRRRHGSVWMPAGCKRLCSFLPRPPRPVSRPAEGRELAIRGLRTGLLSG